MRITVDDSDRDGRRYDLVYTIKGDSGADRTQRVTLNKEGIEQIKLLQGAAESRILIAGTIQFEGVRSDVEIPEVELENVELDELVSMVNILTGPGFPLHRFVGIDFPGGGDPPVLILR